jgi:cytosine/creatinine deaminase
VQSFDVIFERAKLADGTVTSIGVQSGRIAEISTEAIASNTAQRVDLDNLLVVAGLVDGHIHLDKSFIGEDWRPHRPCTNGFNVRQRVAFEKELLASARPIETRAAALTELAISRGTMYLRTHVDIDAEIGLRNLKSVLAVKESYRDLITIEVVAFPQSGILASPGTADLLAEAVANGADLVGGLDPPASTVRSRGILTWCSGSPNGRALGSTYICTILTCLVFSSWKTYRGGLRRSGWAAASP